MHGEFFGGVPGGGQARVRMFFNCAGREEKWPQCAVKEVNVARGESFGGDQGSGQGRVWLLFIVQYGGEKGRGVPWRRLIKCTFVSCIKK